VNAINVTKPNKTRELNINAARMCFMLAIVTSYKNSWWLFACQKAQCTWGTI